MSVPAANNKTRRFHRRQTWDGWYDWVEYAQQAELSSKLTKSGSVSNNSTISDVYKSMDDNTFFAFSVSKGYAIATELGITGDNGGAAIFVCRNNSWRGFAIAIPISSFGNLQVGYIYMENTIKWAKYAKEL